MLVLPGPGADRAAIALAFAGNTTADTDRPGRGALARLQAAQRRLGAALWVSVWYAAFLQSRGCAACHNPLAF
jgi:hypothetical protein